MVSEESGRRGFVRKLVKFATLGGVTSLIGLGLLGEQTPKADAQFNWSGAVHFDDGDGNSLEDPVFAYDDANKFLGIGVNIETRSIEQKLHLVGSGPRILIESSDSYAPEIDFKRTTDGDGLIWAVYKHGGTNDLRFYQGGDKVTFQSGTGRVGIGTNNPASMLHLVGVGPKVLIEGTTNFAPEVNFKRSGDSASTVWALYKNGDNDDLRFYQGGDKVTIQNGTGNVGIGTTNPTWNLHVAGDAMFSADKSGSLVVSVANQGSGSQSCGLAASTDNITTLLRRAGVQGDADQGDGVSGGSTSGNGVTGISYQGVGLFGGAGGGTAKPIVARGSSSQSANLQEWQNYAGTPLAVVDKAGQVGVGTSAPVAPLHLYYNTATMVKAEADGSTPCILSLDTYAAGSTTSGAGFVGRHSRGSKASPTDVAVGDRLGFNIFGGYAGGAFRHVAGIEGVVDTGTVSTTSLPSAIRFLTTPDGSMSRQERMRIDASGNMVPPTDNSGNIGTASKRWSNLYVVTLHQGDIQFENGARVTEQDDGFAFVNPQGVKTAVLDAQGNFHIKGKVMEDL